MPPRIYIRPPRRDTQININDSWQNTLEPAVQQIYNLQSEQRTEKLSFKVLYDSTYKLVTQGHGRTLYRKFIETTHKYLETLPPLSQASRKRNCNDEDTNALGDDHLLSQVTKLWQDFQVSLRLIGDIFMYLDRSFCGEAGIPPTDQVGNQLFRDDIIKEAMDPLFDEIIRQINKERNGHLVNNHNLRTIIDMLSRLTEDNGENSPSLYDAKFRQQLVANTMEVYQTLLNSIATQPALAQLHKIEDWLKNEAQLGVVYLPEETRNELIKTLETEVFDAGLAQLFQKSTKSVRLWISENNLAALELASELETRGPSRHLVKEVSQAFIDLQRDINKTKKESLAWVESTIDLRYNFMKIAESVKQDSWNAVLSKTHHSAIGESSEASNLLAMYLDEHLKKNNIAAENVEPALDKALVVYNSLSDRDEFSLIFQRLLARRLLNNSSRSREYELSWLQRLKEENLNSDALNFERMIMNIDESRQLFHGSASIAPGIVPTSVNVLSMHLWPRSMLPQNQYPLVLPPTIADAQLKFQEFYASVKRDRVLKWNYGLSNVDVKIRVEDRTYLASVPLVCMSILELFSGSEVYSTQEIADKTNIPMGGELERHLKSLYIAPGSELLVKSPPGKEVTATDEFAFNTGFKSAKAKFKVKKISASKSSGSGTSSGTSKEEADFLAQERAQKAEAAIVRILKARKELLHAQLVQATASMLHSQFSATPQLIKRAIQSLLAKEYIERKENDSQVYKYIA